MKLGPLDFRQPSTWRGLLSLLALGGWALSPALRDQIALALATALSAIELFRDEYRARNARDLTPTATAQTTGPNRAAADAAPAEQLRVPTVAITRPNLTESHSGFGDR